MTEKGWVNEEASPLLLQLFNRYRTQGKVVGKRNRGPFICDLCTRNRNKY